MALVLHWDFDNVSGGNVTDSSGHGNNGTGTAASFTAGISRLGQALVLDGTSTIMYLATSPVQNYPFTVSCWVVRTGTGDVVWSILDSAATSGGWTGWYAAVTGGNTAADVAVANSFSGFTDGATSTALGYFDHVVYVARDATHRDLYINGVLSGTDTASADPHTALVGSFQFAVGASVRAPPFTDAYFKGNVVDVQIYDQALSPSDIAALHTAGILPLLTPGQPIFMM